MSLDESSLVKKFESVTNTQDKIQSLSLWILHHSAQNKKLINCWTKVLERSNPQHRLTLLYLANDVIQNEKRKKKQQNYQQGFKDALRTAIPCLRDDKIRQSVFRVLGIWQERSVYPVNFIAELKAGLSSKGQVNLPTMSKTDFKLQSLLDPLEDIQEIDRKAQLSVNQSNTRIDGLNIVLNRLKDKSHTEETAKECDAAIAGLEDEIANLERAVEARKRLVSELEKAQTFFETKHENVRQMSNSFASLCSRIMAVKKKFNDHPNLNFNSPGKLNAPTSFPSYLGDEPKGSLDQRLSSIIGLTAGAGFRPDLTALQNVMQMSGASAPPYYPTASIPPPPPPNDRVLPPSNPYESYSSNPSTASQAFHQIQSVISARTDPSASNAAQLQSNYNLSAYGAGAIPHENFEPSDMDLGSDSEETPAYVPSRPNSNNLKVIEPQQYDPYAPAMLRMNSSNEHRQPPYQPSEIDWRGPQPSGPRIRSQISTDFNPHKDGGSMYSSSSNNDYGRKISRPGQGSRSHGGRRGNFSR